MDACNVRMVVDFDGGFGERFENQKKRFAARYPGRVVHFARLAWRPFERQLARSLHEHVLTGIELESRHRGQTLIARGGP